MVFDSPTPNSKFSSSNAMKLISFGDGGDRCGPANTQELMKFWVEERESIPCFLAALTLECYDKEKKGAGSSMDLSRG